MTVAINVKRFQRVRFGVTADPRGSAAHVHGSDMGLLEMSEQLGSIQSVLDAPKRYREFEHGSAYRRLSMDNH